MTEAENATLPAAQIGGDEMPEIVCVGCGNEHGLIYQGYVWAGGRNPGGSIRGVLTCHRPIDPNNLNSSNCNQKTVFELTRNAVTWAPGNTFKEGLRQDVAEDAKEMFREALLCFYGGSGRGTVVMCRSTVEEALTEKNVTGDNLDARIKNAPDSILGDEERTSANGARLTGRNAAHRMAEVTTAQAMLALVTTVDLVNHIAQQSALPASQSEPDNNES